MLKDTVIANKSCAVLSVAEEDSLDKIAVEVIKQDCPDFLVPFKTLFVDGEMEIRYELTDGIRLSYQPQRMYKREFIRQMVSMLLPFRDCGDWLLDYHSILLDPHYIIIDEKGAHVRYVYLPVSRYAQPDETILAFFSRYVVNVELLDDRSYTLELLRILQDGHSNLLTLLDHLQKTEEAGRVVTPFEKEPATEKGAAPSLQEMQKKEQAQEANSSKKAWESPEKWRKGKRDVSPEKELEKKEETWAKSRPQGEFGKSDLEGELLGSLYKAAGSDSKKEKPAKEKKAKKGLFGGLIGKKTKEPDSQKLPEPEKKPGADPAPVFVRPLEPEPNRVYPMEAAGYGRNRYVGEDETEMDGDGYEEADPSVLRLRLENSGSYPVPQMIELNLEKGHATVGRYDKYGSPCADFNFDHSLTFVSRNQFRVERYEGGYKIIDLNSGNGTILNDRELVPNISYDLHAGDVIVISRKTRLTYRVL